MVRSIILPVLRTTEAFRKEARTALSEGIPPEGLVWSRGQSAGDLFAEEPRREKPRQLSLGKDALDEINSALVHRDPERFTLIYSVLWRIAGGDLTWADRSDASMLRLMKMAKAVRRDVHKMHAFTRFRELDQPESGRRNFAAFFEPEHPITEAATPFFARRFGDMNWVIVTPEVTAKFDGGVLSFSETDRQAVPTSDAAETLWLTYYKSIFNPARLAVNAMRAEMPKKYWHNLPEARLIPGLIRGAVDQVEAMAVESAPTRKADAARAMVRRQEDSCADALSALHSEIQACRKCHLCEMATQAICGEGPKDAAVMFVGEQPGDKEDLAGRPFIGPAGHVLREASEEAGVDLDTAYLTNAVKHFKFVAKGKRRLHQTPSLRETDHCKWWLQRERDLIKPSLTVALGATALRALTGDGAGLMTRRGRLERAEDGLPVFVTVHPSMILRLPAPEQAEARRAFVADLSRVREMQRQLSSVPGSD